MTTDRAADAAAAVLERLERIEALDASGAPAATLLEELRALVAEAEAWARAEGGVRGAEAAGRLRQALAREAVPA